MHDGWGLRFHADGIFDFKLERDTGSRFIIEFTGRRNGFQYVTRHGIGDQKQHNVALRRQVQTV